MAGSFAAFMLISANDSSTQKCRFHGTNGRLTLDRWEGFCLSMGVMENDRVSEPSVEYSYMKSRRLGYEWEGTFMAEEAVVQRMVKVAETLDLNKIPYAVIGGLAVRFYVGRVAPDAIRGTRDVDLLMDKNDLPHAAEALAALGFRFKHIAGIDFFAEGNKVREGVHIIKANQKVREEYATAAPDLSEVERSEQGYAVIPLRKLVEMKLNSYRDKDRTHLRDFIEVGLITPELMVELPAALRPRLQHLIDTPNG
ncbi:MAG: hypothetical protein ABI579_04120 [Candidatus Sumerlaeota bacterium]